MRRAMSRPSRAAQRRAIRALYASPPSDRQSFIGRYGADAIADGWADYDYRKHLERNES